MMYMNKIIHLHKSKHSFEIIIWTINTSVNAYPKWKHFFDLRISWRPGMHYLSLNLFFFFSININLY